MKTALAALIVGYGLDLLLGDPSFLYHPIRVIGNLIAPVSYTHLTLPTTERV